MTLIYLTWHQNNQFINNLLLDLVMITIVTKNIFLNNFHIFLTKRLKKKLDGNRKKILRGVFFYTTSAVRPLTSHLMNQETRVKTAGEVRTNPLTTFFNEIRHQKNKCWTTIEELPDL